MNGFHYVYVLVSDSDVTRHYTGLTEDLHARLIKHNTGTGRSGLEAAQGFLSACSQRLNWSAKSSTNSSR